MSSVKKLESLIIEPTNACNLRCRMCLSNARDSRMTRKKGFMDFALFRKIVDETPGINRLSLNNWGESLLHPDLCRMVAHAKEKGIDTVILCTNGVLLDAEKARQLLAAGLNVLEFSIDGLAERYEEIRGIGIDRVLQAVEDAIAARALTGKEMRIGIVMVSTDEEEEERQAFLRQWQSRVDYVKIQPLVRTTERRNPCPELWGTVQGRLVVLWDGTVVPCCVDYDGALKLGDAHCDSLVELWNGAALEHLRREHLSGVFTRACRQCDEVIEEKFRGKTIHLGTV